MANPNERHSNQDQGSQKSGSMNDPARDGGKQQQQQHDQTKQQNERDRANPQHGGDQDKNRQQR